MTQLAELQKEKAVDFKFERSSGMRADLLTKVLTTIKAVKHGRNLTRLYGLEELKSRPQATAQPEASLAQTTVPTSMSAAVPEWQVILRDRAGAPLVRLLKGAFTRRDLTSWTEFFRTFPRWQRIAGKDNVLKRETAWFTEPPCRCS